jgi:hypothetical protein
MNEKYIKNLFKKVEKKNNKNSKSLPGSFVTRLIINTATSKFEQIDYLKKFFEQIFAHHIEVLYVIEHMHFVFVGYINGVEHLANIGYNVNNVRRRIYQIHSFRLTVFEYFLGQFIQFFKELRKFKKIK